MKYLMLFFFALTSIYTYGQIAVGINTNTPVDLFHIDGKGDNTASLTDSQTQNDFIVTSSGKVGIGTIMPTSKLELNGTFGLKNLKTIKIDDPSYTPQPLMRDTETGELLTVTSVTGNTYTMNYVTYTLKNCQGDWVSSFDTKISTEDYILAIVGYSFTGPDGGPIGLNVGISGGTFVPTTVATKISQNSTWMLAADYQGGAPLTGINGTWTINCLLINKLYAQTLSTVVYKMASGYSTGSVSASPQGL